MLTVVLSGFASHMSCIVGVSSIVLSLLLVLIPMMVSLLYLTPLHSDHLLLGFMVALGIAALAFIGRFGRHG
jgi:hypothetical protein